jgi:protein gp37
VAFHDQAMLEPLSWRKPGRVVVNSMSDFSVGAEFRAGAVVVGQQRFAGAPRVLRTLRVGAAEFFKVDESSGC